MPPILTIIAITTFAASLSARSMDPVLPQIADNFALSIATAASLSAATALTFAIVQPFLGAAADLYGKGRLVVVCLVVLAVANVLGAFATSFPMLFATRILAGIGSGGVFPITMGLTSDLVPTEQRQIAMGRVLGGAMIGNLLGASLSGVIGDLIGWRGVLVVLGLLTLAVGVVALFGLRSTLAKPSSKVDFSVLKDGYRTIMANPNARVCFTAVFIEGFCVLGLFPFVAAFLLELGEPRLSIAGLVIAGFAVGGLAYTLSVSRLLPRLGVNGMMIGGATVVASQLAFVAFGPPWPWQFGSFLLMGCGFYMLHGSLQIFASDLAPEARASALALHSFSFFMGQAAGPVVYGVAIVNIGKIPTLLTSAMIVLALGFICARLLHQKPAEMADI